MLALSTFAATVALALAAAAPTSSLAQMVSFATPTPNQSLSPGEPFTVQLDSADGLTGFEHISVVFGIQSCVAGCGANLGTMLFAGNYTPTLHDVGEPMYQNFVRRTVQGCWSERTLNPTCLVSECAVRLGFGPESRQCRAFLSHRGRSHASARNAEYDGGDLFLNRRTVITLARMIRSHEQKD